MVGRVSFGRAASLGLGLLLAAAGPIADAATKPASEKTPLRRPGSQQKPVPRATTSVSSQPADLAPPPIPPPKAVDVKPLYVAQESPFHMKFDVLEPGKRSDRFWQLSGGTDVIVYLERNHRTPSAAQLAVYPPGGGAAVCSSRNGPEDADPFCTIVRPRPGVYEFSIANTSQAQGEFSLWLSLPAEASDTASKAVVKSNLTRPTLTVKK
jgi:hypothetical protein